MIIRCEIILNCGDCISWLVAWLGLGMRNICVCTLRRVWDSLCGYPLVPVHAVPIEPTIQLQ